MTMSSFRKLEIKTHRMVKSLVEVTGLDEHLVSNIVQYAKCLPRDGIADIDEPIFTAQMIRQFNLTNTYMISSLYRSLKYTVGKDVRLKDFCRCICTFLTSDKNLKSEFVFHVYDINGDGDLSLVELFRMVKANVIVLDSESNDNDDNNPVKDLAEMAMRIMGINTNESLTLESFRQLVQHESLCLDMLGQVLPTSKDCQNEHIMRSTKHMPGMLVGGHNINYLRYADDTLFIATNGSKLLLYQPGGAELGFKDKISKLTPFQVHRMFQFERYNSLGEKKVSSVSCYPLIMPLS